MDPIENIIHYCDISGQGLKAIDIRGKSQILATIGKINTESKLV